MPAAEVKERDFFEAELDRNPELALALKRMGQEYREKCMEYINSCKKESTRMNRVKKIIAILEESRAV